MKKFLGGSICSMLILFSILTNAAVINEDKIINFNGKNAFEAVNLDESTIKINVNPGKFQFDSVLTEKGVFTAISLSDNVFSMVRGEAKLPVIRKMIEIPFGSTPEIVIKSISWKFTSLDELELPERIIPAQQSSEKIPEPLNDFIIDENYYSMNSFYPAKFVKIVETGTIRARNFALIEISPIQYKPASGDLKILNSCELIIDLPNCDIDKTNQKIKRYSNPSFESFFNIAFQNYGFYEKDNLNREQEGMLFIVYDNFVDEIEPLVESKNEKGLETTVTKTSEIDGGASKENIFAYIQEAYETWSIPPSYVLLVGDTQQIPTFTGSASYSEADLYYVTVDGSDYFPDIYIGRFSGSQDSHIESMVDKTVYYEQGGFESNDWIKKGAFIASSDAGQLAEETHNYVIDNYLEPNGYEVDKIYESSGGSTSDIRNALNEGRSLCIYSGHGYPGGWACVPFDQNDISNLDNFGMYPFVCSHACSTNTFADSECFGETWLRETDKGGIGFWGASASTYWDEDDILERAMFQAWWEDGLEWLGGMTDMGLYYLYQNYSGGGRTKYYFEAYNIIGDPSLRLWSDNPTLPPEKPTTPEGPTEWIQDINTIFSCSAIDPEGSSVYYLFDWGDGTDSDWVGPYPSGQTGEASHNWTDLGEYEVKVIARDNFGARSEWSNPAIISIVENEPPDKPTITGPRSAPSNKLINFEVVAEDPEGHDVYYMIKWGDGFYMPYTGPYPSGQKVTFGHAWSENEDYMVLVKAKDIYGDEGEQGSLLISISKNRYSSNQIPLNLIQKFFSHLSFLKIFSRLFLI